VSVATTPRQRGRFVGRIAILVGLAAVTAVVQQWYGLRNNYFDLRVYRNAMVWWNNGHPLYDFAQPDPTQGHLGFTYPPFAAYLLRPVAWLTPGQTIALFVVVSVAALAASIWWLVAPIARRHGWPVWFAFGLAFILATGLEPIRLSIDFGQINMVLWALVVFDLAVLLPRHSRFLGVGIGLAAAIKLVPGIFIVYLLVSGRWRGAATAAATAAAATVLAALVAPQQSWTFWTQKVGGDGVGQLAYTMNQSIEGVLARLAAPSQPNMILWLLLAVPVLVFGLWRATRAAGAGDELSAMALTGFVGGLVSPVTWVHHLFWFVPALLSLVDAATRSPGPNLLPPTAAGLRGRGPLLAAALFVYATVTFSMIQWWDFTLLRPGGVVGFVLSNWLVWLMLALLVLLPIRRPAPAAARRPQVAV
jgi:alpha-1,2-mannosyltransferase